MPELRKDPVMGRWVIISTERAKRPQNFVRHVPANERDEHDPFLEGRESETPPEVLSYRPAGSKPNGPGWWVRVVPNKFPALDRDASIERAGDGMYDMMNGVGMHEVVVETPDPGLQLPDMPVQQVQEVIWAWRDRTLSMYKDPRFKYVLMFKNYGAEAGASIHHPHSQIIALPFIPKEVADALEGARRYYDYKERCVYTDMLRQELKDGARMVMENDEFAAFCPFASRFPFEVVILPKEHDPYFEGITKNSVVNLAAIVRGCLRKLKLALNDPSYNMIVHTTPPSMGKAPYTTWRIEILPSLSRVAGFEWGSGCFINPVKPEDAAQFLRDADLPGAPGAMGPSA